MFDTTREPSSKPGEDELGLRELRASMEGNGKAWSNFLADRPDPDSVLTEVDESDGFERDASVSIRLAQALHHGTDHRSQVCTALTALGIEPPDIDVWSYGLAVGSVVERPGPEPSTSAPE